MSRRRQGTVDEILALAGPVCPAGDGDLGEADGKLPAGVVQREGHFGQPHRLACGAAVEDHVLGAGGAQVADVGLAHHPRDGVGDVALARAVRADDRRDARRKLDLRGVREGLEPADLYLLQSQIAFRPPTRRLDRGAPAASTSPPRGCPAASAWRDTPPHPPGGPHPRRCRWSRPSRPSP